MVGVLAVLHTYACVHRCLYQPVTMAWLWINVLIYAEVWGQAAGMPEASLVARYTFDLEIFI